MGSEVCAHLDYSSATAASGIIGKNTLATNVKNTNQFYHWRGVA